MGLWCHQSIIHHGPGAHSTDSGGFVVRILVLTLDLDYFGAGSRRKLTFFAADRGKSPISGPQQISARRPRAPNRGRWGRMGQGGLGICL